MLNKIEEFFDAFFTLYCFFALLILCSVIIYSLYEFVHYTKNVYSYEYVYEYEDIDGNVGISDNCTYNINRGFYTATDNQVCYINEVKTLVKTIQIYGVKKCYIWSDICEEKIYTDLTSLVDYYGNRITLK